MAGKKKEKAEQNGEVKTDALSLAISAINREFGTGAIFRIGPEGRVVATPKFSSGSLKLDRCLGGGYGVGRIVEIYGPESSGKTTLALHAIKSVQGTGGVAAFIDAEHALDLKYAQDVGVNVNSLLISQPDNGEQALNIVEMLVRSGAVQLIVVDSVAALVPKAELEGNIGDASVGTQARLMSQTMRILTGLAQKAGCSIIFINQIRMKIGVMFGNPETTSGGNALKFAASQRIDIRRTATNKVGGDGGEAVSNTVRIKIVKNKLAPPFREDLLEIEYGRGLNLYAEVFDLAVEHELVEKSGSWIVFENGEKRQGKAQCVEYLESNTELFSSLYQTIRDRLLGSSAEAEDGSSSDESEESTTDE